MRAWAELCGLGLLALAAASGTLGQRVTAGPYEYDASANVTLVVTSCNRPNSLLALLESMLRWNQYKFRAVLIAEASGRLSVNEAVVRRFPELTYLSCATRRSQVENIDAAYATVKTPYILHFEEDWLVFRTGFVERSLQVLERYPNVSVVSLHNVGENEWQQVDEALEGGAGLMKRDLRGGWGYFTWGAGLRRLSDYRAIGSNYMQYNHTWKSNAQLQAEARSEGVGIKKHFIHREWKINWLMKARGFRVALFNDTQLLGPYAKHAPMDKEKHVPDEKGASPFE